MNDLLLLSAFAYKIIYIKHLSAMQKLTKIYLFDFYLYRDRALLLR